MHAKLHKQNGPKLCLTLALFLSGIGVRNGFADTRKESEKKTQDIIDASNAEMKPILAKNEDDRSFSEKQRLRQIPLEELEQRKEVGQAYRSQHKKKAQNDLDTKGSSSMELGILAINGIEDQTIVRVASLENPMFSVNLSFSFLDPITGLEADTSQIASVRYEYWLSGQTGYNLLGTSTASGSGFSFDATFQDLEPLILATPFNAAGDPIFFEGVEGQNVAPAMAVVFQSVPDSVSLLGMSATICLGLLGMSRRRSAS